VRRAVSDQEHSLSTLRSIVLTRPLTRELIFGASLRYYIGEPNRPIQQGYYRWRTMFGVKVNF
jgi:hypothetical protein